LKAAREDKDLSTTEDLSLYARREKDIDLDASIRNPRSKNPRPRRRDGNDSEYLHKEKGKKKREREAARSGRPSFDELQAAEMGKRLSLPTKKGEKEKKYPLHAICKPLRGVANVNEGEKRNEYLGRMEKHGEFQRKPRLLYSAALEGVI